MMTPVAAFPDLDTYSQPAKADTHHSPINLGCAAHDDLVFEQWN